MKRYGTQKETFTEKLGGRRNCIAMAIFAALALAIGGILIEIEARQAEDAQYIDSWPITVNRHIELGYAGKGGF